MSGAFEGLDPIMMRYSIESGGEQSSVPSEGR
jgi:hypothetical protein